MKDIKTVFITGTDTGVGKSIFTSYLALKLFLEGKKVAISKSIQTGIPKDTDFLSELTENKIPIFNTYSFSLGAAPNVAANAESKVIDIKKILNDIRKLEKEFDCVLVEGIGGIAVPITNHVIARSTEGATKQSDNNSRKEIAASPPEAGPRNDSYLLADLIKDLTCPVIIVARPLLGTINHTILTIEFAKQKKLNILGFVISGYDDSTDDVVVKTAPGVISMATGIKCLYKLPKLSKVSHDKITSLIRKKLLA